MKVSMGMKFLLLSMHVIRTLSSFFMTQLWRIIRNIYRQLQSSSITWTNRFSKRNELDAVKSNSRDWMHTILYMSEKQTEMSFLSTSSPVDYIHCMQPSKFDSSILYRVFFPSCMAAHFALRNVLPRSSFSSSFLSVLFPGKRAASLSRYLS